MPGSDKILARLKRMIPPLLDKFHKGQLGRVAVIGGSKDYTGAPYFSAMASARLGCDMSHVICTEAAAAVIKTYSPNLMVHPMMCESATGDDRSLAEKLAVQIIDLVLPRVHVLVLGPGLGRDSLMVETAGRVADEAKRRGLGLVIDADALLLVGRSREIVQGYPAAILTPNVVEFDRLCKQLGVSLPNDKTDKENESARVEALAAALGGVTVIQKGSKDYISNGKETMVSDLPGGKKRCGGQGDTLTGSVATFMAWRKAYMDRLWDDEGGEENGEGEGGVGKKRARLGDEEMVGLAAFGGSVITRECSRLAFAKRGRSMQASDLTEEVHNAFMTFFGDIDRDAKV